MSGTDASPEYPNTGYTCPKCGRWVNPGENHACGLSMGGEWTWEPSLDYHRIAVALERIADALEKLAR